MDSGGYRSHSNRIPPTRTSIFLCDYFSDRFIITRIGNTVSQMARYGEGLVNHLSLSVFPTQCLLNYSNRFPPLRPSLSRSPSSCCWWTIWPLSKWPILAGWRRNHRASESSASSKKSFWKRTDFTRASCTMIFFFHAHNTRWICSVKSLDSIDYHKVKPANQSTPSTILVYLVICQVKLYYDFLSLSSSTVNKPFGAFLLIEIHSATWFWFDWDNRSFDNWQLTDFPCQSVG